MSTVTQDDISGAASTPSTKCLSSSEVVCRLLEENDVSNFADILHVSMSTAQSYQLSSSLNNISADMTEEATGSEKNREHEPETEVVSCMLVLSHLYAAKMFPLSV